MKLVILYEELAPYFLKCISVFSKMKNVEVYIIRKGINSEAPFILPLLNLEIYNRSEYSTEQLFDLINKIKPDALFCGGWSDKSYMKIVSRFKGKIPAIVGFDNKWEGTLKQKFARMIAPYYITNRFDRCFVPGLEQKEFALKLGFKDTKIALGAYSCDFGLFHNQFLLNKEAKKHHFPKRFIYVGRYIEQKGIRDLWNAFVELHKETPNEWELWCLGTGNIEPIQHEKIKHFGFVQPKDFPAFIKDTGVFILPSHFEPWGVVVHEFAAAGFPIICSDKVGARTTFVENNYNGYIYESESITELKYAMKRIILTDNATLNKMGERSAEKAKAITPEKWAQQLMMLLK